MTIDRTIYSTQELLGVFREFAPVQNYFLNLLFPTVIQSDSEKIDFEKLYEGRALAPFVSPLNQGRPIFNQGSTLKQFKPAYIKPKDPVDPSRMIKRAPGEILNTNPMSPMQRYNAAVADVLRTHSDAIQRRWEWMAARAALDGAVTVEGEGYPSQYVDFGRDAGHTVVHSGGALWTTSSDILGDIETQANKVRRARFGGIVDRITFGADAWDVARKNEGIRKQLDATMRGSNVTINTGVMSGAEAEYVGNIGSMQCWVYSGYYEAGGSAVPYMNSKDVFYSSPSMNGVRAFGAILDKRAGLAALPIFPKMWDEEDPSATQVMTQSAPLMVPVNPNATLKATVLS